MKILHVINNLGSGGAEKFLSELLPLQAIDNEVHLLILDDTENYYEDILVRNGVKVHRGNGKLLSSMNIFWIARKIYDLDVDIIHSHLFPSQYWTILSKVFLKHKNLKYITTEHSTDNRRRKLKVIRFIEKWIYKKYDYVISISESAKRNLDEWVNLHDNKSIVIENGINLETSISCDNFAIDSIINNYDKSDIIMCMVGRFSSEKDQDTIIRALSMLDSRYKLILVGEGIRQTHLESLANKLKVEDRIYFTGYRRDVPCILRNVDLVIMSSHWEGFGLAALEGMAIGKVVIASNVMGLKDVVDDYRVLFEKENPIDLKEKIINITNDYNLRSEIEALNKIKARQYDINKTFADYKELYEK